MTTTTTFILSAPAAPARAAGAPVERINGVPTLAEHLETCRRVVEEFSGKLLALQIEARQLDPRNAGAIYENKRLQAHARKVIRRTTKFAAEAHLHPCYAR